MANLIKVDENYYENLLSNSGELKYTLTIPEEYLDKELYITFTFDGKEIYKQLVKRDEEVRFV